jgi:hypothetical protein
MNLKFKEPEFLPGLNVTVRNGVRWSELLNIGGWVTLCDLDDNPVQEALVAFVSVVMWRWIKHSPLKVLLEYKANESRRTVKGMEEVLDACYPNGWGPWVTLIGFVPEEKE